MRGYLRNHTGSLLTPLICSVIMTLLWFTFITIVGHDPRRPEVYLIAALLCMLVVSAVFIALQQIKTLDFNSRFDEVRIDPWEMQRRLMVASVQPLPQRPELNNVGALYALMTMEELGGTLRRLAMILARRNDRSPQLVSMTNMFSGLGQKLEDLAQVHRVGLAQIEFYYRLDDDEALELFEGTTGVAFTNCGFALACGLPGADGYDAVARSNLSKINPDTGFIEKTTDGKWIKGEGFFKPNLAHVLHLNQPPYE